MYFCRYFEDFDMRDEIAVAVLFLTRLIGRNENLNSDKVENFKNRLCQLFYEKFKNHWFPDQPYKGQGYRCIRVNVLNPIDPIIKRAASDCGLKYEDLNLPMELTLWVDPDEVCCRFGEHKGSYCILASSKEGHKENYIEQINIEEIQNKCATKENQQHGSSSVNEAVANQQSRLTIATKINSPYHKPNQQQQQQMLSMVKPHFYIFPIHTNSLITTSVLSSSPPPLTITTTASSFTPSTPIFKDGLPRFNIMPRATQPIAQRFNYAITPVNALQNNTIQYQLPPECYHFYKRTLVTANV